MCRKENRQSINQWITSFLHQLLLIFIIITLLMTLLTKLLHLSSNLSIPLPLSFLTTRPCLTAWTTFGWIYPKLTRLCCFISFSFRYQSSSFHSLFFYVILLKLFKLFNFYRHFKSTPLHTYSCSHFVFIRSSFREHACLGMQVSRCYF